MCYIVHITATKDDQRVFHEHTWQARLFQLSLRGGFRVIHYNKNELLKVDYKNTLLAGSKLKPDFFHEFFRTRPGMGFYV